jgi:hypothetical protein
MQRRPRTRQRRFFRKNAPLLVAVQAAQQLHPRFTVVYSRLEAVRLAIVSRLSLAQIGRNTLVQLSRISVYRCLSIAQQSGIDAVCGLPTGHYRAKSAKITPAIGEKLTAEIKSKRITTSKKALQWLRKEHSIKMKATGIYSWLRRHRVRLRRSVVRNNRSRCNQPRG